MDKAVENVLEIFDEINTVPRQSEHLEKIHPWLMDWAREHGFETATDDALNVLIKVPGTPGYENAPTVILQGHMDMVCEKRNDVDHDFGKDPIISRRDGEWLRAEGTSLGADNAIALALFFDLVTDPSAEYPPLEILITSDEETGLVGAQKMAPDFVSGKILLNLDSEDEGVFTIGCAGGMDSYVVFPVVREKAPRGGIARKVVVSGLQGGHSGAEIHLERANANAILARVLDDLISGIPGMRIATLRGGTAHNAIPRDAEALVVLPASEAGKIDRIVAGLAAVVGAENAAVEPDLAIEVITAEKVTEDPFAADSARKIVDALRLMPHGIRHMSSSIEGVVETSMNFAVLRTEGDSVKVNVNQRSAVESRGRDFSAIMDNLARLAGGSVETGNEHPSWEPQRDSELLRRCIAVYQRLFGSEPRIEVTHAGLECGAIGARVSGLEMISFGPTILQPHSPDERLHMPSVGKVRTYFRELLRSYRL